MSGTEAADPAASPPASAAGPPGGWRRLGSFAALSLGLLLAAGLVLGFGWRPVLAAATAIGAPGFALFCGYWLFVLVVLGAAWAAGAPGAGAWRLPGFVWGRLVRESAADILPFSQVGGLVLGARAVTAAGVGGALVWASLVVDVTTEMASQLVYTLFGVAGLGWRLLGAGGRDGAGAHEGAYGEAHGAAHAGALWAAGVLLAAGLALTVVVALFQRRGIGLAARLAERILPGTAARADAVLEELARVHRRPGRVLLATALHGAGWVASAGATWLALRLMGAPLPFLAVMTVESLMYAAKSFGFAIPGGLGVQEGAYALIGPLFGLPAETALALSFLKRARDVALGVPTLLVFQLLEGRRALKA